MTELLFDLPGAASRYPGQREVYLVAPDDRRTPEAHTLRFAEEVKVHGGHVEVALTGGGHSTGNFAVCESERVDDSLRRWRG